MRVYATSLAVRGRDAAPVLVQCRCRDYLAARSDARAMPLGVRSSAGELGGTATTVCDEFRRFQRQKRPVQRTVRQGYCGLRTHSIWLAFITISLGLIHAVWHLQHFLARLWDRQELLFYDSTAPLHQKAPCSASQEP